MKTLLIAIATASLTLPAGIAAQFEVASIRPADPGAPMSISRSGQRMNFSNIPIQMLITWAFDITNDRLFNRPAWLDSVRYDVQAQASEQQQVPRGGYQNMMQSLLASRFGLVAHHEMRQLSAYTLSVAKSGFKIRLADVPEVLPQNPFSMTDSGHLSGAGVTAEMLAKVLSNQVGRAVIDQTGLRGVFDFTLEWTPDTSDNPERPSIFTAIREQLGLELKLRTLPVDVIVIDHIERTPSEN